MNLSVMQLVRKTIPFFITRIMTYLLFGLAAFIFLGIIVGIGFLLVKIFGDTGVAFIILMLVAFSVIYAALKLIERYFLYMVKTGHVAVITELLQEGKIPEGKGMIAYGKDQVTSSFGAANVAFLLDNMVHAAVRQIQRWILRIANIFKFIPGSQYIFGILNAIMSVALNYIDEAIMSYIFLQKKEKDEQSVWRSATDGVILYAQSWKGMIKGAVGSVIFIYAFNIIVFLITVFPLMFIGKMIEAGSNIEGIGLLFGLLALIGAYVITTVLKRAIIDPVITIIMIRSYQMSIRGLTPNPDMQRNLLNVSSRFKRLFNKAQEESHTPQSDARPSAEL